MKIMDDGTLSVLCLELAELMKSGITLAESFLLLSEEADPALRPHYRAIYMTCDRGEKLSAALGAAGIFPERFVKMAALAEETGALEKIFRALGTYYRRQEGMKKELKRTLTYPLMLFFIMGLVYFVFLTKVLPIFDTVLRSVGGQMQGLSRVFLNLGLALKTVQWPLLAVFVLLAGGLLCVFTVPAAMEKAGAALAKIFAKTKTQRALQRADLAAALSLSVSGARDIREALALTADFAPGDGTLQAVARDVGDGMSLSEALEKHKLFAPVYGRMLKIAERSGSVDTLLAEAAARMDEEARDGLEKLSGAVEPALVAVLTLGVGLLLLAVMLPLVGILSAL